MVVIPPGVELHLQGKVYRAGDQVDEAIVPLALLSAIKPKKGKK